MSHTYSSNRVHVIFSTKNREKRIPPKIQPRFWAYMAGIARNHGFEALAVGGVENHVHALLIVPPTIPLSKAGADPERKFLQASKRRRAERIQLAGGIGSIQRQCLADGGCDSVHRESIHAPCEAQL